MLPSIFNVRVKLSSGDVFVMNTLTDAQLVVSGDVVALLDGLAEGGGQSAADGEAMAVLSEHGFVVPDRRADLDRLEARFAEFHEDTSQLRVTILTTLQCNFACPYCYQGEGSGDLTPATRMSASTAARVADWIGRRLDAIAPERLVLTFFGGEPLLNPDAMFAIAARCHELASARGVTQIINLITNGLLLSEDIVDRLLPLGLTGVKVTLDGDRETHDRMRPMRGGQGTFDRIIDRVRRVAGKVPVAIGGNFDQSAVDRFPVLLDFLASQDFAPRISRVTFKPVIHTPVPDGMVPVTTLDAGGRPLPVRCGSAVTEGGSMCDACNLADDAMTRLREETIRHGLPTIDGVHMGPCELYRRHSHTIGPDGSLFACPGFTGNQSLAVGHIGDGDGADRLAFRSPAGPAAPWRRCGECAFIPVCGGGCAVAARTELGDMGAPSCHKRSLEAALVSLADSTVRQS